MLMDTFMQMTSIMFNANKDLYENDTNHSQFQWKLLYKRHQSCLMPMDTSKQMTPIILSASEHVYTSDINHV